MLISDSSHAQDVSHSVTLSLDIMRWLDDINFNVKL